MKRGRIAFASLGAAAALVAVAGVRRSLPPDEAPGAERAPAAEARETSRVMRTREVLDFGQAFVRQPLPSGEDAFRARSWAPPPAAPQKLPPPKLVAPALPFVFSGVMEDAGRKTLFLRRGEALLVGHEREVLDSLYRIDAIEPEGVVLTYLPLDERQTLAYPR